MSERAPSQPPNKTRSLRVSGCTMHNHHAPSTVSAPRDACCPHISPLLHEKVRVPDDTDAPLPGQRPARPSVPVVFHPHPGFIKFRGDVSVENVFFGGRVRRDRASRCAASALDLRAALIRTKRTRICPAYGPRGCVFPCVTVGAGLSERAPPHAPNNTREFQSFRVVLDESSQSNSHPSCRTLLSTGRSSAPARPRARLHTESARYVAACMPRSARFSQEGSSHREMATSLHLSYET